MVAARLTPVLLVTLLTGVILAENSTAVPKPLQLAEAGPAPEAHGPPAGARAARSATSRFLDYIRGYDDEAADYKFRDVWTPRRREVQLASMPVLVVPVERGEAPPYEYKRWGNRRINKYEEDEEYDESPRQRAPPRLHNSYSYGSQSSYSDDYGRRPYKRPEVPAYNPAYYDDYDRQSVRRPEIPPYKPAYNDVYDKQPLKRPEIPAYKPGYSNDYDRQSLKRPEVSVYKPAYSDDYDRRPLQRPQSPVYKQPEEPQITPPALERDPQVSVEQLVQMFKEQKPSSPHLPPILQSAVAASELIILPDDEDDGESEADEGQQQQQQQQQRGGARQQRAAGAPPRPTFTRPLKLRAALTVPRADYSETYVAWWNPATGESRIHFHGGSAVTFRKPLNNGQVRKVEMHVDRSKQRVVNCGVSLSSASSVDLQNPALPDMQLFKFAEYLQTSEGERVERWEHVSSALAAGETLTTTHQLVLARDHDHLVRPLRYKVKVDSSMLGPGCDEYEHVYLDARVHSRGPEFFEVNIDEYCDKVDQLNASLPQDLARLEPLREFTLPYRDPRYDSVFQGFKSKFNRQYTNNLEDAIRKNVLMQTSRLVSSGNRVGARSRLRVNFLADRLEAELATLAGGAPGQDARRAESPPPRRALQALQRALPDAFDWRQLGAVSPVQHQRRCSSCWAFAVAGAVEGALFRRTGRLVPLSQQCLVDCAEDYGGKGCNGTWPSHAYEYVKEHGLPALDQYTEYQAKKLQCRDAVVPPVTRISAHVNVTKFSVPALQVAIMEHGPVVVLVDCKTKAFLTHDVGILYDERCRKRSTRHAMLAVGWGHEDGEMYFILKNTWSASWGERGYVRLHARSNTCGVLAYGSYPRLEDSDILQAV